MEGLLTWRGKVRGKGMWFGLQATVMGESQAGRSQRGHRNTGLTGAVAVGIASEDTFEGCFSSAKSWKVTKARK